MLKDGAHVDTGGFDADTPLIASAERGDADVIRALLRARADVQATDKFEEQHFTELQSAVVVRLLASFPRLRPM